MRDLHAIQLNGETSSEDPLKAGWPCGPGPASLSPLDGIHIALFVASSKVFASRRFSPFFQGVDSPVPLLSYLSHTIHIFRQQSSHHQPLSPLLFSRFPPPYIPRGYTLPPTVSSRRDTLLSGRGAYWRDHISSKDTDFETLTLEHNNFFGIMKAATGIALLASAGFTSAATLGRPAASPRAAESSQQLCALGSVDENGNYFCQAVNQILYTNMGTSDASYQDVVFMDPQTGECQKQAQTISGGLAPFDEPVRSLLPDLHLWLRR